MDAERGMRGLGKRHEAGAAIFVLQGTWEAGLIGAQQPEAAGVECESHGFLQAQGWGRGLGRGWAQI